MSEQRARLHRNGRQRRYYVLTTQISSKEFVASAHQTEALRSDEFIEAERARISACAWARKLSNSALSRLVLPPQQRVFLANDLVLNC
jgi:hypothetical protein